VRLVKFLFPQNFIHGFFMARPRTPTNILEMRGAFKKDPQRARDDEPEAAGAVGDPPERFNDGQRAAWNDIVKTCHKGVLCAADGLAVEIAAILLDQFRTNPIDIPAARIARLDSLLARFGMTPSDRSKVTVPKDGPKNPFADVLGKGKKA
jgi:hypothetical protein